ncbi:polysaccharide biosynthesis/export family protein [Rhodovulum sp. P5]|uniref:polysaccharide biosynthesis/export family protein n=1 Tax=Rhodovulum sp. P5 TaxID=1564506 RepID=UPI0020A42BCA|nr:polysaccharide biosynthesis/export family protein [Rhodovulum sp. P5]
MHAVAKLTALVLILAGCSTVYRSPAVVPGADDGAKVRVLPVTAESVLQANRSSYDPKTLPAIFAMTAGTGGGLRGVGDLPDAPVVPATRPGVLELTPPPPADPGPYLIGVGDVVLLSTPPATSTIEELSGLLAAQNSRQGYTVQDDGTINIPNVGRVRISGMTVDQAEAELFQALVSKQIDPTFSLEISGFKSQKVSIGGAVAKPAVVPITLTPLYLDEALAAVGGLTVEDQDYASIRIYRDGALYQIPLKELYSRRGLRRTRLVNGDAVFVDTEYDLVQAESYFEQQIRLTQARQETRRLAMTELQTAVGLRRAELEEARSNYQTSLDLGADDRDYVYLSGEFNRQTRFALPYGRKASLADAIYDEAQGVRLETGDVSQVYVLRASTDPREFGAITAWHLNLRNAAKIALMPRFELRPDDVIFVAAQPVTRWGRTISQITPSLITQPISATLR